VTQQHCRVAALLNWIAKVMPASCMSSPTGGSLRYSDINSTAGQKNRSLMVVNMKNVTTAAASNSSNESHCLQAEHKLKQVMRPRWHLLSAGHPLSHTCPVARLAMVCYFHSSYGQVFDSHVLATGDCRHLCWLLTSAQRSSNDSAGTPASLRLDSTSRDAQ